MKTIDPTKDRPGDERKQNYGYIRQQVSLYLAGEASYKQAYVFTYQKKSPFAPFFPRNSHTKQPEEITFLFVTSYSTITLSVKVLELERIERYSILIKQRILHLNKTLPHKISLQ